jgi:hypothetical protein
MKRMDREGIASLNGSTRRKRAAQVRVVRRSETRQNKKTVAENFLQALAVEIDGDLGGDTGRSKGALGSCDFGETAGSFFRHGLRLEHECRAIVITVAGCGQRNRGNAEPNQREHRFTKLIEGRACRREGAIEARRGGAQARDGGVRALLQLSHVYPLRDIDLVEG